MKLKQKYIAGAALTLFGVGVLSGCQQTVEKAEKVATANNTETTTNQSTESTQKAAAPTTAPTNPIPGVQSGSYKDGTYTGVANGYRPNLNVQVVVSGGKINSVEVTENNETPNFLSRANLTVTSEIVAKQTTQVTAVSGATRSSNGIMNATANALANAIV